MYLGYLPNLAIEICPSLQSFRILGLGERAQAKFALDGRTDLGSGLTQH